MRGRTPSRASVKFAPTSRASLKSAPRRSASLKSAPARSRPWKDSPRRSRPRKSSDVAVAPPLVSRRRHWGCADPIPSSQRYGTLPSHIRHKRAVLASLGPLRLRPQSRPNPPPPTLASLARGGDGASAPGGRRWVRSSFLPPGAKRPLGGVPAQPGRGVWRPSAFDPSAYQAISRLSLIPRTEAGEPLRRGGISVAFLVLHAAPTGTGVVAAGGGERFGLFGDEQGGHVRRSAAFAQ